MNPITAHKKHFNPETFPYEVFGFWEEYIDADTLKSLGDLTIAEPHYPMGSTGRRTWELTHDLTLTKGLKQITVKASPQKPRRVTTMIQAICGRKKQP